MKKYKVNVCRIGYAHTMIEVKAANEEKATAAALDEAGSHSFSEHDADYTVEYVEQVK